MAADASADPLTIDPAQRLLAEVLAEYRAIVRDYWACLPAPLASGPTAR